MQTSLPPSFRTTAQGKTADAILRKCVHCGLCTASCPTYRLLGDERDSPRGRIYLIKGMLETGTAHPTIREHLDRCLLCRACETACPSGVEYGRLFEIGRQELEQRIARPLLDRWVRRALRMTLPYPRRVHHLTRLARIIRPLLPRKYRDNLPLAPPAVAHGWPQPRHRRTMLLLEGCVQPVLAPTINTAAARVFDRLGITVVSARGCCGALSYHLSAVDEARGFMRRNIDRWWPVLERGAEALVISASGCGAMVRDYGDLLRGDPHYAAKAARLSALARDPCQVLMQEDCAAIRAATDARVPIAFHAPCTLQNALKLAGVTETLLQALGFNLVPVQDPHLCCGSAGTYSILQGLLSRRLLAEKVKHLEAHSPALIATANIGCYQHLKQKTRVPVKHWIELLDPGAAPMA